MNQIRPSTRPLIALFCLPILGTLVSGVLGLSFPAGLLPVILAAAIGAWLGCRLHVAALDHQISSETTLARPEQAPAAIQPAPFSATGSELTPKLRHDIRGIISPAMLAADQLDENPDPLVQKAAQTITESLERLLLRLKQQPPA